MTPGEYWWHIGIGVVQSGGGIFLLLSGVYTFLRAITGR